MSKRRKIIIGAIVVAVLAIIAWFAFSGDDEPDLATAAATRGTIERTVEATGTLEPKELVSVGAQVSGRVEELTVEVGDTVDAGQLIAEIDSRTQTNTLKTAQASLVDARAQLANAKASLTQAQLAFDRQEYMGPGEATSRADYEAAEADLANAKASYNSAQAQVDQARINVDDASVQLGFTRITAPMSGVVVAVVTKQGQTVNANQSAPTIVILAKLDVMTVKAEVSEADVINVEPGLPVYFTILGDPDTRYDAELRLVEPAPESIVNEVDSSSSSSSSSSDSAIYYNALFEVNNEANRLRALMTAKVTIVLDRSENAVIIPSSALGAKAGDGSYTVRVQAEDGTIENRTVTVGIDNNVNAEVLTGLDAGERVVIGEATATDSSSSGQRGPMGPPPM